MFDTLHSSKNKELFESTFVIKVATIKNTDDFCYKRKPLHATTKSTLFAVSKGCSRKILNLDSCRLLLGHSQRSEVRCHSRKFLTMVHSEVVKNKHATPRKFCILDSLGLLLVYFQVHERF